MTSPLGVAIVGCGHIAPKHVEAIRGTPGLELRAVCDIDAEKRSLWAARERVPAFADLGDVLVRDEIDIVAICTPNHLHVPMARAALGAGKHAVVEKPVALSAAEAVSLGRDFARVGVSLFVVLQVRFNPAVLAALDAVRRGCLGRLYVASLTQRWSRNSAYFAGESNWHGKKELEGGALFTQGVHYIDLLLLLAGPVAQVSARTATLAHTIETEDVAVAYLTFRSGAVGVIEFSLNAYKSNLEAGITLLGERGNIQLGGTAANEITHWDMESSSPPRDLVVPSPNDYDGAYVGSPPNHGDIYRNVVAHLAGREAIAVTAEAAAEPIRVIEAIYASGESGGPVCIPVCE